MSKTILGVSSLYHDSAAAIVNGGDIIAAAQEERFSRKKHDPRLPKLAINYCLEEAFIEAADLDAIVFYDNPLLTWDRVVKGCIFGGESAFPQFKNAATSILGSKLWVEENIKRTLGSLGKMGRILIAEHHMAHAASAFYPSPFTNAAILTLDGVGEWETTTLGKGDGNRIELYQSIEYPHSLGLLYSAFTYYCGFEANSGEYKLMGLAPYGKPTYYDTIRANLIDIKPDGSFRLNTAYFGYLDSLKMTNERFDRLFGGEQRLPESRITTREMNLAASIQKLIEEIVILLARSVRTETGCKNLVMAGGVALNCVVNGKIVRERIFDNIWIQPAASDAGCSLGAALLVAHTFFEIARKVRSDGRDSQKGSYLGPKYGPAEITAFLKRNNYPYTRIPGPDERARVISSALAKGQIVGYFTGRMEFGPRALGARSILGDPRRKDIQSVMNLKIKFRESFRPFAPSVLVEDCQEYFKLDCESPYMLLVAAVRPERRVPNDFQASGSEPGSDDILAIVNQARSDVPAVTHVDYSARIQTVDPSLNPEFYHLIKTFKKITGYGLLVNTSFNVRDEPIVCSPQDAYACFMRTGIDLLVLEDCLLWKQDQPVFSRISTLVQEELQPSDAASLALIKKCFFRDVLPISAKLRASVRFCFPEIDPACPSYFIERRKVGMNASEFGFPALSDRGFEIAMTGLWTKAGFSELLPLAAPLGQLARDIRVDDEQSDEVSPDIYVMF